MEVDIIRNTVVMMDQVSHQNSHPSTRGRGRVRNNNSNNMNKDVRINMHNTHSGGGGNTRTGPNGESQLYRVKSQSRSTTPRTQSKVQ